jgi:hypothetical protein
MAEKQIGLVYYGDDGAPDGVGTYPLDENRTNTISFSHEWWSPAKEAMDFLKTVFDAADVSFLTAAVSAITDISNLLGTALKPLNYYAKAWKDPGQPFTIDVNLSFRFGQNGSYDGNSETVVPAMNIIKRTLPISAGAKSFVRGPGPTPADIFSSMLSDIEAIRALMPSKASELTNLKTADLEGQEVVTALQNIRSAKKGEARREATIALLQKWKKGSKYEKEILRYVEAYIFEGGMTGVLNWDKEQNDKLKAALQKDALGNAGLSRTWEISIGNYWFKHLVCIASGFTFHPEVDSSGYPIHSEVFLTFQPYLIALSNTVSDYGWHV